MRILAHLDVAESIRVLQVGKAGKGNYSRWDSQDIEMGEREVNGIHPGN